MARVLVNVPPKVTRGQVFDIRVLIAHPMESGQRRDDQGVAIARDIIHSFTCTYGGELVLQAELFPAISANPFLSFSIRARDSGPIVLAWTDDHGTTATHSVDLVVT